MTSILIENDVLKVKNEIIKISEFYNLKINIKEIITNLEPYFSDYTEIVMLEDGFELIIGGIGDNKAKILAKIANNNGLPKDITNYFLLCAGIFKNANLGLKLCFGGKTGLPTLYIRTKTSVDEGISFLEKIGSIKKSLPLLIKKLSNNNILYGLGFSSHQRRILIKTYSIGNVSGFNFYKQNTEGFISYRLIGEELQEEIKSYLPDTLIENFEAPNYRWEKIKNFLLNQLNIEVAGHIGVIKYKDSQPEYKIYLERIGAIPTDFSAR